MMQKSSALTNGQSQYVMRELFNTGVDIFDSLARICREQLEETVLAIRALVKDRAIFWYRTSQFEAPCPIAYQAGDNAYFVNVKDILRVELPYNESLNTSVIRETDEQILDKLLHNDARCRAYINGRIIAKHPHVTFALDEYLDGYPYTQLWCTKFPGIMDTNVRLYDSLYVSAGDVLNQFVQMLGGGPVPVDVKKDLNRRLS